MDEIYSPSHVLPTKLPTHSHENEPPTFEQIPPFLQGTESHGLGFNSVLR